MNSPAPDAPPPQARSPGTLAWLVGAQGLLLATLVPWFVAAGLSLAALGAADPGDPWPPRVFVGVVWSYPILPVACSLAAWRAYARRRWRRAAVLAALPLLPALPLLAYLFWLAWPA
ncbi:MAG TPA: hypothetical protein VGR37_08545 [Longimicrobiaceae bacterium]|nr:hypothetical protein [Longimicrobiaceae bacterium]